ncbi:MAG: InlB B-repeat-containing protein, partial [Clostridia bacterium]|nr:InlB B-repeat-containing protein [Clostridia bacterium]
QVPAKEHYTGAWESYELKGGDITVNAVYTAIEYTVTFTANGQQVGEVQKYTVENTEISVPQVPAKEHYTGAWESYELKGENVTVNAIYTAIEYTVTFTANGQQVGEVQNYTVENTEIVVPQVPAKEHYTGAWESYELKGGDITVNAVYTAIVYHVTFIAEGNKVAVVDYTVEDTEIDEPAVPEKKGYSGVWETYELTSGDITVNAVYTQKAKEGCSSSIMEQSALFGTIILLIAGVMVARRKENN